jgi:nucleotide-binding universal stress UspA family protein
MYRTILVPLDGSAFGEHALPFALTIARRSDASIELVHVHAKP